ncbi:hypothetical protein K450DRAFT_231261 [Umbelopsis ramanniana AG]|uniref:Uncharacterized protein n=1 Tax=Umbelopsis ramanniana AG TaxID=1314678 RepID=A0AAD5HEW3_UMBRA|nr:uncharacterized protein K450DRAFT_231261 [Umbelopsis ramanniana AG]KAI8581805.1 hypothetical protein K450DRAFT_231261 [Umbelopsis ramanniana AG]
MPSYNRYKALLMDLNSIFLWVACDSRRTGTYRLKCRSSRKGLFRSKLQLDYV